MEFERGFRRLVSVLSIFAGLALWLICITAFAAGVAGWALVWLLFLPLRWCVRSFRSDPKKELHKGCGPDFIADKDVKAEKDRIAGLPDEVRSLVGVKGIYVTITDLNEDARSAGLTKEQLKTDVELKLRLAGIKLNSPAEWFSSKHEELFLVTIATDSEDDSPSIAYTVAVELSQLRKLPRRPHARVFAPTWGRDTVGMCLKNEFPEEARKHVKTNVDKFINDYLKANPKE